MEQLRLAQISHGFSSKCVIVSFADFHTDEIHVVEDEATTLPPLLQEVENAEKLLRKPTKFEIMRRFKSRKTKRKSQIMHPSHLTEVRSDEFPVSPHYTNTLLSKQVKGTKEMIRWWIVVMSYQIFRTSSNRNLKEALGRFKILVKRERKPRWGGGGGYPANSYIGGFRPEVKTLSLLYTTLTEKVPLSLLISKR